MFVCSSIYSFSCYFVYYMFITFIQILLERFLKPPFPCTLFHSLSYITVVNFRIIAEGHLFFHLFVMWCKGFPSFCQKQILSHSIHSINNTTKQLKENYVFWPLFWLEQRIGHGFRACGCDIWGSHLFIFCFTLYFVLVIL